MSIQSEYRRRAREAGIPWDFLQRTYADLRRQEREDRQRTWDIRRESWERMVPAGCREFWRHGWQKRYRRAFEEGDQNLIHGFDVIADGMALCYPELATQGEPDETLFALLKEPHNRLPSAAETWESAWELCQQTPDDAEGDDVEFAFGANAEGF